MTHIVLLVYVAKNSAVKITTNDGREIVIANRESIVADAGCAFILPKGEQKFVPPSDLLHCQGSLIARSNAL